MKRNFVLTKYYKSYKHIELYPIGVKAEYNCIDKAIQALINDEIDYFKYEYNELITTKKCMLHI